MQYHLDTIPVWEAMEQNTACPLCALYRRVEASEIERSLGGSVMEPDARIRVNEKGICARHHGQLFAMQNRLGHALLVDSHTRSCSKSWRGWKNAPPPERSAAFSAAETDWRALRASWRTCAIHASYAAIFRATWSVTSIPFCICGKPTRHSVRNGRHPAACACPTRQTCFFARKNT